MCPIFILFCFYCLFVCGFPGFLLLVYSTPLLLFMVLGRTDHLGSGRRSTVKLSLRVLESLSKPHILRLFTFHLYNITALQRPRIHNPHNIMSSDSDTHESPGKLEPTLDPPVTTNNPYDSLDDQTSTTTPASPIRNKGTMIPALLPHFMIQERLHTFDPQSTDTPALRKETDRTYEDRAASPVLEKRFPVLTFLEKGRVKGKGKVGELKKSRSGEEMEDGEKGEEVVVGCEEDWALKTEEEDDEVVEEDWVLVAKQKKEIVQPNGEDGALKEGDQIDVSEGLQEWPRLSRHYRRMMREVDAGERSEADVQDEWGLLVTRSIFGDAHHGGMKRKDSKWRNSEVAIVMAKKCREMKKMWLLALAKQAAGEMSDSDEIGSVENQTEVDASPAKSDQPAGIDPKQWLEFSGRVREKIKFFRTHPDLVDKFMQRSEENYQKKKALEAAGVSCEDETQSFDNATKDSDTPADPSTSTVKSWKEDTASVETHVAKDADTPARLSTLEDRLRSKLEPSKKRAMGFCTSPVKQVERRSLLSSSNCSTSEGEKNMPAAKTCVPTHRLYKTQQERILASQTNTPTPQNSPQTSPVKTKAVSKIISTSAAPSFPLASPRASKALNTPSRYSTVLAKPAPKTSSISQAIPLQKKVAVKAPSTPIGPLSKEWILPELPSRLSFPSPRKYTPSRPKAPSTPVGPLSKEWVLPELPSRLSFPSPRKHTSSQPRTLHLPSPRRYTSHRWLLSSCGMATVPSFRLRFMKSRIPSPQGGLSTGLVSRVPINKARSFPLPSSRIDAGDDWSSSCEEVLEAEQMAKMRKAEKTVGYEEVFYVEKPEIEESTPAQEKVCTTQTLNEIVSEYLLEKGYVGTDAILRHEMAEIHTRSGVSPYIGRDIVAELENNKAQQQVSTHLSCVVEEARWPVRQDCKHLENKSSTSVVLEGSACADLGNSGHEHFDDASVTVSRPGTEAGLKDELETEDGTKEDLPAFSESAEGMESADCNDMDNEPSRPEHPANVDATSSASQLDDQLHKSFFIDPVASAQDISPSSAASEATTKYETSLPGPDLESSPSTTALQDSPFTETKWPLTCVPSPRAARTFYNF
ncbi:hypothetical protein BJ508DRAFT_72211 [Ascobolus immersus RN42]|uniref:LisH domain-containing protein n=1 Tax=Ascobolus immersus RN42 TaxID=1160509 RepID=A0A3N4HEG9_ASCIM|nr:hypothetical protein BJ508DRAFT_72211 [Ascobolus immersus RN42]